MLKTPRSLDSPFPCAARKTTAPAPSPNKTQVFLSVQSTIFDKHSAPATTAVLTCPKRIILSASVNAYTKPEHAAEISNAGTPTLKPSSPAIFVAVDGVVLSGVIEAKISTSTSSGVKFASAIACATAFPAITDVVSFSTTWRLKMPVLVLIHSSFVSECGTGTQGCGISGWIHHHDDRVFDNRL